MQIKHCCYSVFSQARPSVLVKVLITLKLKLLYFKHTSSFQKHTDKSLRSGRKGKNSLV